MASIRKEITVNAKVEQVWDVMRDIGALHTRGWNPAPAS
jgi:hypothetical protein